MTWYKCSNGELVNLDQVSSIRVRMPSGNETTWHVVAMFRYGDYFTFPEGFATREAAVMFIAELYDSFPI